MGKVISNLWFMTLLWCGQAAMGQYELIDLGTRGYPSPVAYAINEQGQVVGAGGLFYDPLTGDRSITVYGFGINDHSHIAGLRRLPNSSVASVFYDAANIVDIGTGLGVALDINNIGQLVGNTTFNQTYQAFLYDPVIGLANIGTSGLEYSSAAAINNNGLVVGHTRNAQSTDWRAFSYTTASGWVDMSVVMGNPTFSLAEAVNESGLIVGRIGSAFSDCQPFVYNSQAHTYQTLGSLGVNMSGALGVNDLNQVVGYYATVLNAQEQDIRPFFWDGQTMIDLNTWLPANSGWTMTYAHDINNSGWIVGSGIAPDGKMHACLIRPVPEPSVAMFLSFGVYNLLLCQYRKQRHNNRY